MGEIILGDCLEVMKRYPDNHFDLVLTDPPYEINLNTLRKRWNGDPLIWEVVENDKSIGFSKQWFAEVDRVSKNYVIFGANNFIRFIPDFYGWIVWDKRTNERADRMFGSPFELAITKNHKKYKIYRIQHGGVINADSKRGNNEKRYHPTQKPIALMKAILLDFTKRGDKVLDPFMGSGTTLIAAKELGRECIGIEISPEYVKIAQDRLKQEILL